MINQILVFPRVCLEVPEAIQMKCKGQPWFMISISSTIEEIPLAILPELKAYGCLNYLALAFGDLTPEGYYEIRKQHPNIRIFSEEDAEKILEFVDVASRNLPSTLVVHCDAGISRSGAVGDFLCDYLHLDRDKFDRENSILPNRYIVSVLRRVAGMLPFQS